MPISIPSLDTIRGWVKGSLAAMKKFWNYVAGPAIGARLLDPVNHFFPLEVRNVRGGAAIPRVFLDNVTDEKDRFTGLVTSPVEINFSGRAGWPRLFGEATALFVILAVDWRDAQGPSLWVDAVLTREGDDIKTGGHILIPPTPLDQQKGIRLTIRVVFYSAEDAERELTDKVFRYSVEPIPASGEYRVRLLKPRHTSIFDG